MSTEYRPLNRRRARVRPLSRGKRSGSAPRCVAAQTGRRAAHGRSHSVTSLVLPVAERRATTVLVVDDFNPFSKLVREALTPWGFAVFGAKSPDEGLALF